MDSLPSCLAISHYLSVLPFRLAVMAGWFQVFKVDSFVFFGTANTLYQQLKAHLAEQKATLPKAERTKYLIFDLTEVTGIDSSARDVFYKVHRLLKSEGINLVWAITNPKVGEAFEDQGLYVGAIYFDSLDLALRHVEDELLRKAHHLSEKWLVNQTVRDIFQRQGEKKLFPGNLL
jgi:MFS superfamily sulfate permease-like transporter